MKSGSWLSIRALCLAPGPARRSGEEGRTLPLLLSPGSGRNCVSGTPATAFPLLSPCLQRVGDVAVERDRSQLVGLATHAQVHRAALVVCWPLPERVGRQAAQLVGAQPGATDGLDDREVTDGRGGGGALASGAELLRVIGFQDAASAPLTIPAVSGPQLPDVRWASAPVPEAEASVGEVRSHEAAGSSSECSTPPQGRWSTARDSHLESGSRRGVRLFWSEVE